MATPSAPTVFRIPGKLIANPSNGTGPDYGGTILGAITKAQFDTGIRYAKHYYDEIGRTGEISAIQKDGLFRFALRSVADADAMSDFFPNSAGGVTNIGGGTGLMSATKAGSYLWAPDRPNLHPGILLLNAVPLIQANEQSLRMSILFDCQVYVALLGLPLSVSDPIVAKIGLVGSLLP